MSWLFSRTHLFQPDEVYLVVLATRVWSAKPKEDTRLGRFFSSIYNKPIAGVSFFTLSLVSVSDAVSHPLLTEQVVKHRRDGRSSESEAACDQESAAKKNPKGGKRKAGRPKGSKNKDKRHVEWNGELRMMDDWSRSCWN
ncbi:MAG: hypothetical protein IPM07_23225 [Anaerolineales bacterium]|nr:hypothetical protein [Anaerolineales bacterium]